MAGLSVEKKLNPKVDFLLLFVFGSMMIEQN